MIIGAKHDESSGYIQKMYRQCKRPGKCINGLRVAIRHFLISSFEFQSCHLPILMDRLERSSLSQLFFYTERPDAILQYFFTDGFSDLVVEEVPPRS